MIKITKEMELIGRFVVSINSKKLFFSFLFERLFGSHGANQVE